MLISLMLSNWVLVDIYGYSYVFQRNLLAISTLEGVTMVAYE